MIKEKEYTGQGYSLIYVEKGNGVVITGFSGRILRVEIPERIENKPVVGIDKKAFLSRKTLKHIVLPETVTFIDDWAFAYCSNLESICIPSGELAVGRALFLECSKLTLLEGRGWSKETGHLLAAAVTDLDAHYLLDTESIGSEEWLQKWDARVLTVMQAEDMDGYQNQVLCGEEDYGSTDVGNFIRNKRKYKVRLAMLRLLNSIGIAAETRAYLEGYLKNHTKGCESEETWQTLLQEYYDDLERIQLFLDLGCADEGNLDGILLDIGEEHAEMKAIFLRYQDTHIGYHDFFADLEL